MLSRDGIEGKGTNSRVSVEWRRFKELASFVPIFVRHPNLRAEGLLFDAEMGDPRLATDIRRRFPPSARHLYARSTPLRRGF